MDDFQVAGEAQAVLPISIFLIGYVLAPLFFGPLSEQYGRQRIVIITFCLYIIFTMACALAPNWHSFLIFRLFCGISASAPIAIVGGVYADIYDDPVKRGLAMAIFMAVSIVRDSLSRND
jgi:MFS family permease